MTGMLSLKHVEEYTPNGPCSAIPIGTGKRYEEPTYCVQWCRHEEYRTTEGWTWNDVCGTTEECTNKEDIHTAVPIAKITGVCTPAL